jgi:hypothetical protein
MRRRIRAASSQLFHERNRRYEEIFAASRGHKEVLLDIGGISLDRGICKARDVDEFAFLVLDAQVDPSWFIGDVNRAIIFVDCGIGRLLGGTKDGILSLMSRIISFTTLVRSLRSEQMDYVEDTFDLPCFVGKKLVTGK